MILFLKWLLSTKLLSTLLNFQCINGLTSGVLRREGARETAEFLLDTRPEGAGPFKQKNRCVGMVTHGETNSQGDPRNV